jgi:hypothetical protein
MEIKLHRLSASALGGSEWLASFSRSLITEQEPLITMEYQVACALELKRSSGTARIRRNMQHVTNGSLIFCLVVILIFQMLYNFINYFSCTVPHTMEPCNIDGFSNERK